MNLQSFLGDQLIPSDFSDPTESEQQIIISLYLAIGTDPRDWPEERRGWRTPSEVGLSVFYPSPYWRTDKSKPTLRIHISEVGEKWISEQSFGPDGKLRKKE